MITGKLWIYWVRDTCGKTRFLQIQCRTVCGLIVYSERQLQLLNFYRKGLKNLSEILQVSEHTHSECDTAKFRTLIFQRLVRADQICKLTDEHLRFDST